MLTALIFSILETGLFSVHLVYARNVWQNFPIASPTGVCNTRDLEPLAPPQVSTASEALLASDLIRIKVHM